MGLYDFYEIMTEIKNTSSRSDKEGILFREQGNYDFKYFLHFLYNDFVVTGLSKQKMGKWLDDAAYLDEGGNLFSDIDAIGYITRNNTGSDKAIATIRSFMRKSVEILPSEEWQDYHAFLEQFFCKEFKSGLTAKTINKVYGKGFLPTFEVQLAKSFDEVAHEIKADEVLTGTLKLDGHRCVIIVKSENDITFKTRSGRDILGLIDLEQAIREMYTHLVSTFKSYQFVLDGELTIKETNKPVTEIFNETSKILHKNGEKTNLVFNVFDWLPYLEFVNGKSKMRYLERRAILDQTNLNTLSEFVKPVEVLLCGSDVNSFRDLASSLIANGEEGLMINRDTIYECKRNKGILKMKGLLSADLEVVGFEEGEKYSKYEGMLGKLIVDYKGLHLPVGSGLTDEMRKEVWENQDAYLGKVAEILFTSETTNKDDDTIKMRYARFKCWRFDKGVDDINYV